MPVDYLRGFRDIIDRGPCPVGALFAKGGIGGVDVDSFGGDCAFVGNTPVTLCTRCFIRFGVDSFPGGKHRSCASIWFNPCLVGFVIIAVHFV